MKELTKAEEQVMQALWKLGNGYLKDILEQYDEPRPAYTTVSTVVNVLVKKGMIQYKKHGKTREYSPAISREQYSRFSVKKLVKNLFDDSPGQFANFFAKESDMSKEELQELQELIDQQLKKKQ